MILNITKKTEILVQKQNKRYLIEYYNSMGQSWIKRSIHLNSFGDEIWNFINWFLTVSSFMKTRET